MEPADAFITLAESDPYPEGAGKSDSSSSPASPGSSQELLVARRSRPPGRKGHFKSRNGCLNCKRRRVKCNEEHPECYSCRRLGLLCEYAAVRGLGGAAGSDAPPRPVLSTLTFEDLHFYHQFLTIAFPTLPLGGFQIWQQCAAMSHQVSPNPRPAGRVPGIAHASAQYNHLGHAVLALGAAHVAQNGDPSSTAQALKHRVAAMKLVNEQLAQPARSQADGDALLGSIMILSAQSALLPDAMIEYMTLTRGGNLVATSIMPDFTKSLFRSFSPEGHAASLTKLIRDQPGDQEQLCAFRSSLLLLEPFCRAQSEVDYVRALKIIPVILEVSSREGRCPGPAASQWWLTGRQRGCSLQPCS